MTSLASTPKTTTVVLTNDFHATSTFIRVPHGWRTLVLTSRRVRDIKSRLCGMGDCTCSDALGRRGHQASPFELWGADDGSGVKIIKIGGAL